MAIVKLARPAPDIAAPERALGNLEAVVQELRRAGLFDAPLDVAAAARHLGLKTVYEDMDPEMSGFLERRGQQWVVGVNSYHHPVRQRFTIAHEIAHFVLHRGMQDKFDDQTFARRNVAPTQMEREADRFAASLLMPDVLVRAAVDSGIKSLNELARRFTVSSLAMKYRLRSLNYSLS